MATVGGNICLSLPAGPMTSLASALDGVVLLRGPGETRRSLPAADFVTGDGRNELRAGELLTHVWLPSAALQARSAYRQLSLSPVGRSAVLVIARRDPGGQTVVTVTASTPRPVKLRFPPRQLRPRPWPRWTRPPRLTSATCTATRPGGRP